MNLSVITVNYNGGVGLIRTLKSIEFLVERCLWGVIDLTIVDGKSTDGSPDVIRDFILPYPHKYRYVIEPDEGIYDAMNKALNLCSNSDFVIFMNSGDYFLDEAARILENINVDNAIHVFRVVSTDANLRKISIRRHKPADLIHGPAVPHQGVLIPTKYHRGNLYDTSYKILADYDFFCSALVNGVKFELINEEIANFEHGGMSSNRKYASVWYAEIRQIQRDHFGKTSFKMQARFLLKYVYQHIPFSHKLEPIIRRIFL